MLAVGEPTTWPRAPRRHAERMHRARRSRHPRRGPQPEASALDNPPIVTVFMHRAAPSATPGAASRSHTRVPGPGSKQTSTASTASNTCRYRCTCCRAFPSRRRSRSLPSGLSAAFPSSRWAPPSAGPLEAFSKSSRRSWAEGSAARPQDGETCGGPGSAAGVVSIGMPWLPGATGSDRR
jgi:hypothetical protein